MLESIIPRTGKTTPLMIAATEPINNTGISVSLVIIIRIVTSGILLMNLEALASSAAALISSMVALSLPYEMFSPMLELKMHSSTEMPDLKLCKGVAITDENEFGKKKYLLTHGFLNEDDVP
ncbi:hypothetical protein M5K25_021681 [Dendrobium thyrsiflorum]|uniref:Uncharacterized protein n=1 Tax=Dendrobium thyrsiflorum TaxID=117978 RepID=A0ABD0UAD4_DENTH